ncbi:MAG: nicotinamide mononucleotide transporter [Bacteroidetes bacterium]|nr:nicotinamide mononucleotide transporter [Bacteroidota bacterium]MBS1741101.1 nicotinamide mononucleotide transporter [Bacteroidota bacterium]
MQEIFYPLIEQLKITSVWEWIAVVFGLIQVLLAWRNKILLYPAGIISTGFSILVLANVHLFAEAFLNLYYLIMSVYGWWHWRQGGKEIPISKANQKEWLITLIIVIPGWWILYILLSRFTPSDVPIWDALVSSTAWAGMWLLARRKLENWIMLNISNALAVPLQFHKQIPLYAIFTFILFIVAILGFVNWRKLMNANKQIS